MEKSRLYMTEEVKIKEIPKDEGFKEEKIHSYFEKHLKDLISADLIATEYNIGTGRMDSLALDDDNRPVIIEYKRDEVKHALIQSLFYKEWLSKNRRQFYLEVKDKLGEDRANNISWNIRIILVAQNFDPWTIASTEWVADLEMFKYSFYDNFKIINLEFIKSKRNNKITTKTSKQISTESKNINVIIDIETGLEADWETAEHVRNKKGNEDVTNLHRLNNVSNDNIVELYNKILEYISEENLEMILVKNKDYWSFKRAKKYMEIVFGKNQLTIHLNLNKKQIENANHEWKGDKGHWGTLLNHFKIKNNVDFERIKPLLLESYNNAE